MYLRILRVNQFIDTDDKNFCISLRKCIVKIICISQTDWETTQQLEIKSCQHFVTNPIKKYSILNLYKQEGQWNSTETEIE